MSSGARARFEIVNVRGLHARAASQLAQLASTFPCDISLQAADGDPVNAKSVMGVLLLCGAKGTVIEAQADGDGAEEALEAIGRLIAGRFGEPE